MRIGLFGGTFNPIHLGHLRAAEEAREKASLQRIIFVPSGVPPLKSEGILPARERLRLVKAATADNLFFEVSDIEINQEGKSYTVDTIDRLAVRYNGHELFFIMGIDAFIDMPLWYEPERLTSLIDFIVLTRPGYSPESLIKSNYITDRSVEVLKANLNNIGERPLPLYLKGGRSLILLNITAINISSTMIRENLRKGYSVRYLVPEVLLTEMGTLKT